MENLKKSVFFVLCFWIATLTGRTTGECIPDSNEPSLQIMPEQDVITWPVQKAHIMSCKACVKNRDLVSDMKWYDNNGREIERKGVSRTNQYTDILSSDLFLLFFPSLTESQAGNYTCTATYASTQKLKKMVVVTTIIAITFVDAPEEQFPILESNYKIKCKVEANPKPSVDWYKDGVLITKDDHYIPAIDGLNIKGVVASDDGVYTCRVIVIDTGELAEKHIKVEVHTPPKFLPMKDVEVIEGEPATLQCRAEGKPNPKYTWIKKRTSENLASADRFRVDENTGELWISRVSSDDRGDLICQAKNAAGSEQISIVLDVIVRPKVITYANISVAVGSTATLTCSAFGQPMPEVRFRKFGSDYEFVLGHQMGDHILVENRPDFTKQETIGILTITALERSDDGLYECVARNKGGEGRKIGHLTVEFKPSFVNTPMKEAWTWERHPVNLTCIAESIPNATIIWKFNDRDLERNEYRDPQITKIGNGPVSVLQVIPIGIVHYGNYKCIATNKLGTAETIIQLREAKVPTMVLQATLAVVTATTITFSFAGPSSDGGMPLRAYIVRYKKNMEEDWGIARNKTWAVDSPYILENLDPLTRYTFEFAAKNDVGIGPWGAQVSHHMPRRSAPAIPRFLNRIDGEIAYSSYSTQFELQWQIPADNGEFIDRYELSYCPAHRANLVWETEDEHCEKRILPASNSPSFLLTDLRHNTFYKVELRAHNIIGDSVPGEMIIKTAGSLGTNIATSEVGLSSGIIISAVVVALLVVLLIIDLSCYCVYRAGLIMLICEKSRSNKKKKEDDIKLGSDEKEPLKSDNELGMIKSSMKVDYDMKKSISRTSFVGKDSAV